MQKNILIIDDDEFILEQLHGILKKKEYQVTDATNGEAGLQKFAEGTFDLVITDIHMPDKDGLNVVKQIRNEHKSKVPIIAISSGLGSRFLDGSMDPLEWAKDFGANASFSKPLQIKKLQNIVKFLLNL